MCLLLHSPHSTEVVSRQMQTRNLGHQPESYLCHGVTGPSAGGVPGAWAQGIDWPQTCSTLGMAPSRDSRRGGEERPVEKGAGSRCLWLSRSVWPPWHCASFIDFPSLLTGLWPASFLRPALTIFLLAVFCFLIHVGSKNSPDGYMF